MPIVTNDRLNNKKKKQTKQKQEKKKSFSVVHMSNAAFCHVPVCTFFILHFCHICCGFLRKNACLLTMFEVPLNGTSATCMEMHASAIVNLKAQMWMEPLVFLYAFLKVANNMRHACSAVKSPFTPSVSAERIFCTLFFT